MKQMILALAFLLATSAALAQVPRTINYQGRARDNAGPVTGQRSMTLRLYTTATGGASVFSETHPAQGFDANGTFSVVIGGATPDGIPEGISFAQPMWLGVTIAGFNNDNELPRLQFHSAASSLDAERSTVAIFSDSSRTAAQADMATTAESAITAQMATTATTALNADRAMRADTATIAEGLKVPLAFTGVAASPILDVSNTGSGPAIRVFGQPFAIISGGIDSTNQHFIAGGETGNGGIPARGGFYRDNAPLAWATIDPNGNIISDFGVAQVLVQPSNPGFYEVILDNPVVQNPPNDGPPQIAPVITPQFANPVAVQPVIVGWALNQGTGGISNTSIIVRTIGLDGPVNNAFSIVVFGRPAR